MLVLIIILLCVIIVGQHPEEFFTIVEFISKLFFSVYRVLIPLTVTIIAIYILISMKG